MAKSWLSFAAVMGTHSPLLLGKERWVNTEMNKRKIRREKLLLLHPFRKSGCQTATCKSSGPKLSTRMWRGSIPERTFARAQTDPDTSRRTPSKSTSSVRPTEIWHWRFFLAELIFLDPPEIIAEKAFIQDGIRGIRLELVCVVHASPKANISWYKDGQILEPETIRNSGSVAASGTSSGNSRLGIEKIGRKHLLTITNLDETVDSGTYTCHATNPLGERKENFYVMGKNGFVWRFFVGYFVFIYFSSVDEPSPPPPSARDSFQQIPGFSRNFNTELHDFDGTFIFLHFPCSFVEAINGNVNILINSLSFLGTMADDTLVEPVISGVTDLKLPALLMLSAALFSLFPMHLL